ncbi:MAG: response regulator receiver domain [Candidatus Electrothrix aestuarii]|uniref:Response regulator receiver domain n=1 Tax=Candidatus Electrothrix aestuarii TaxID=3062594 RepID=A0AAU8LYC8_9BACT|nr:response regulator receiver domain [Candidatus Electrothrix aestuarii]
MNKVSTLGDFTRKAVEDFIQTVVFIDDKIYTSYSDLSLNDEKKKQVTSPGRRKPATKSAAEKKDPSAQSLASSEDNPNFSPHDIQASFAKKRIVCSLHQPRKTDTVSETSIVYKLCSAADIVIVDWNLHGDIERAKTLVENLVVQSLKENPHQLRLVLVYTDTPNLFHIADQLSERLSEKVPDEIEDNPADKGLAFHTSSARVVVFGKPTQRLPEFKDFEVEEKDLADRAIAEFCKLADGMLQGCILQGLAAIRKNSRKVLTRFHSGLDGAFLTHRALGLPHEEAFDHITPLLVAELEAILEDSLETPLVNDGVLKDWCDNHVVGKHIENKISGVDIHEFTYRFCCTGYEVLNIRGLQNKPAKKQLPNTLCPDNKANPPSADQSSMSELAILMSQKAHYKSKRNCLKLGTVLRECSGGERYLLCLQPVCDSVRLSGSKPFLFCYLDVSSNNKKVTHIIPEGEEYCELSFNPCKENRLLIAFSANHKETVSEKKGTGIFLDDKQNKYKWIAQLKPDHAQQAAEKFARELSRVGLTESEWLRLRAK